MVLETSYFGDVLRAAGAEVLWMRMMVDGM